MERMLAKSKVQIRTQNMAALGLKNWEANISYLCLYTHKMAL